MKREEVFTFVAEYLADNLSEVKKAEDVHETDDLMDDLGMESMEHIQFMMACEKEFGISIPAEDESKFSGSVGQAVDYIYQKI